MKDYYAIDSEHREKLLNFLMENKIGCEMLEGDPYKLMCNKIVEDYSNESKILKPILLKEGEEFIDEAALYLAEKSIEKELEVFNSENIDTIMTEFTREKGIRIIK